jgi:hypothetical protein
MSIIILQSKSFAVFRGLLERGTCITGSWLFRDLLV